MVGLEDVEVGLLTSLDTFRKVLKELNLHNQRWWLACDPLDSSDTGTIVVGYGTQGCKDPLNRGYFRIPVLSESFNEGPERLLLLFHPSVITCEETGYFLENGRYVLDCPVDFEEFFDPVKEALLARLGTKSLDDAGRIDREEQK